MNCTSILIQVHIGNYAMKFCSSGASTFKTNDIKFLKLIELISSAIFAQHISTFTQALIEIISIRHIIMRVALFVALIEHIVTAFKKLDDILNLY